MKHKKNEPRTLRIEQTETGVINQKIVWVNLCFNMRTAIILFAAVLLPIALPCCGPGVSIGGTQRNAAGTRSVILSDMGSMDAAMTGTGAASNSSTTVRVEKSVLTAEPAQAAESAQAEKPVIEIKEKMFIAQTNDVYLNPEDYLGRIIKLEGLFKSYSSEEYNTTYCFVLRYGPGGCCGNDGSAGFEVAWDDELKTGYPEEDDWVEALGVLKSYEENDYPYLYLSLSSLTVKDERGTEFVSQ
jgi:uncharacterized membrane protein YcgQ (UPF0703/DUF1980 family)